MNHIRVKIMKFSKKLVIAATVLPLALGSASALAYGGGKGGHHGKGGEGIGSRQPHPQTKARSSLQWLTLCSHQRAK